MSDGRWEQKRSAARATDEAVTSMPESLGPVSRYVRERLGQRLGVPVCAVIVTPTLPIFSQREWVEHASC
ncbi:MAG: hypothetical protein M1118_09560, partial [Chloroflexi bacterium]|nr:hypothetical protein [Chloroflexota bacterium]